MMLKTDNGFLDFNGDVEIERQVLLFEELDETRGDFSYSFDIERTHNNCDLLGQPYPDNGSKIVYQRVNADLLSDSGTLLYKGFLRIERLTKRTISLSFFSGNSNWLSLLTGDMTELELSQYDQDITPANIESRWTATSGIVFPLIDTGVLIDRGFYNLVPEDFVGCFYLHTLMKEVMQQSGLKIVGELLTDPLYNKIVVVTNTRSKVDIDNNSIYVGKNDMQVVPDVVGNFVITFNLQTGGYFVGQDASFTTNTEWTAPYKMLIDIDIQYRVTDPRRGIVFLNGAVASEESGGVIDTFGEDETLSTVSFMVEQGDVIDFRMTRYDDTTTDATVTEATMRITPRFIYRALGKSSVPLWSKLDFVNNVFSIFNCITDYDPFSKTITVNLFDKIKNKTPVDLSAYIDDNEIISDYADFISNYGKRSILTYQEGDEEELADYNIGVFLKYGTGAIEVDNELIPDSVTILESDFTAPISYINPVFDTSLERINFVEYEDVVERDITSVTDASGVARFMNAAAPFQVGDLVRIESTFTGYDGVWEVTAATFTYIEVRGLGFVEDATGVITKVRFSLTSDENVYLMVYVNGINVPDISVTRAGYYLDGSLETSVGYAFFNLLNTNTQVNEDYKQGLAFGTITSPLFYQRTLLQSYWGTTARVLNDPVKITILAYLPEAVYRQMSPLTPIYIKTGETTNLYYRNRDTGFYPCEIELIKLP